MKVYLAFLQLILDRQGEADTGSVQLYFRKPESDSVVTLLTGIQDVSNLDWITGSPNVMVEWLTLVFLILEVPG